MALDFPNSPSIGDNYTDDTSGNSYNWDGVKWIANGTARATTDIVQGLPTGIAGPITLNSGVNTETGLGVEAAAITLSAGTWHTLVSFVLSRAFGNNNQNTIQVTYRVNGIQHGDYTLLANGTVYNLITTHTVQRIHTVPDGATYALNAFAVNNTGNVSGGAGIQLVTPTQVSVSAIKL